MQISVPLWPHAFHLGIGDLPVSVDSATAVPVKSTPAACPAIDLPRSGASPCYHLALHTNPVLVGPVLAAVRSLTSPRADWANHKYTLPCAGESQQGFAVTLRSGRGTGIPRRNGPYDRAEVTLEATSSGDLTGDGRAETSVLLSCSPQPGNFAVQEVQIFAQGDQQVLATLPTVVNAPAPAWGLAGMYLAKRFRVSGGALRVGMLMYATGDSHASGPSHPRTVTWRWDGRRFQSELTRTPTLTPQVAGCGPGRAGTFTVGPVCLPAQGYEITADGRGGATGSLCDLADCPRFSLYTGKAYAELMQGGPRTDGPFRKDAPDGWVTSTGLPMCMGGSGFNGSSRLTASGLAPFGSKKAEFRQWTVGCSNGETQMVTAWILPITHVVLVQQPARQVAVGPLQAMVAAASFSK
jgi:hypothetical protein